MKEVYILLECDDEEGTETLMQAYKDYEKAAERRKELQAMQKNEGIEYRIRIMELR